MKILFLTIAWPKQGYNLYSDLMEEFIEHGHQVYVAAANEKRNNKETYLSELNRIKVLNIKCGNVTKVKKLEKAFGLLTIDYLFKSTINKYWGDVKFDLIIMSTPPVNLFGTYTSLKKRCGAKTYLLLKDIWPQGPTDMGAIKKWSLVWFYFRLKEKRLYKVSDFIGCMSQANVQYILEHNKSLCVEKVEECPNSIKPRTHASINRNETRRKYRVPEDALVFIFGGNLGKPQGVSFLIDVATQMQNRKDVFFLIVGAGTEYSKLEQMIKEENYSNIILYERLPKEEYEQLCRSCDVGLILLDKKFTIPNFPSRLLSYLDIGMPVLCATDNVCDMGDILEEWNCGIKTLHGDINSFVESIDRLVSNKDLRMDMSINARKLLEQKYTTRHSYNVIMKHFRTEDSYV